jgi:P27 family predicted phage terminase small subunit
MGRRGPLPDPTSERSATGRNTLARRGVSSGVESVTPPGHVSARPLALAFWEMHAPTLADEGRLRQVHGEVFGQLCHLHADIRQLSDQIAAEGWITASEKGQSVSPVARLLRDSRRDFVTLAGKFGLTAADEARLPADEAPDGEEDPDEAALRKFTG